MFIDLISNDRKAHSVGLGLGDVVSLAVTFRDDLFFESRMLNASSNSN